MRSKAPLALMEQVVMVLVFALAAVLCLKVFVFSDQASLRNEAVDQAVAQARNAAEALKGEKSEYFESMHAKADENGGFVIWYDEDWAAVEGTSGVYQLQISCSDDSDAFLWTGEVAVFTADGEELFRLPVAGQNWEVTGGGA